MINLFERVVWTRGKGCSELAATLALGPPLRAVGELDRFLASHRAGLLVARKLSESVPTSMVSPSGYEPDGFARIAVAVSGGPHSSLAVEVGARLTTATGRPAQLISAFRRDAERADAAASLNELAEMGPELDPLLIETKEPKDLLRHVADDALLVLGAPGGSWLQRLFLGPGARLVSGASAGVVVVRRAPVRAYQLMGEPLYVSPHLGVQDALRITDASVLPVVEAGELVGIVSRTAMLMAGEGMSINHLMAEPRSLGVHASASDAMAVAAAQGGFPVAVVDQDRRLVGTLAEGSIPRPAAT